MVISFLAAIICYACGFMGLAIANTVLGAIYISVCVVSYINKKKNSAESIKLTNGGVNYGNSCD